MCLDVTYKPYATSSKEQTGNIIMFAQFEQVNLLSVTRGDAEISDKSDDHSIIPPLISEEEMNAMDSDDESEDEPMSTEMLEDICDSGQYHPSVKKREARSKIRDSINFFNWNGKES